MSKERFEIILPDLESCRKKTKPRKLVLPSSISLIFSNCSHRLDNFLHTHYFSSMHILPHLAEILNRFLDRIAKLEAAGLHVSQENLELKNKFTDFAQPSGSLSTTSIEQHQAIGQARSS